MKYKIELMIEADDYGEARKATEFCADALEANRVCTLEPPQVWLITSKYRPAGVPGDGV